MAKFRYYQGPPSEHFDGQRFHNLSPATPKTLWDFLRWRLTHKAVPWPQEGLAPLEMPVEERVSGHRLKVTFINHATVLLQTAGLNILTDPVWSQRASPFKSLGPKRITAPGLSLEKLPPIDLLLISHNHYDHLDLATVQKLLHRHQPLILMGLGNEIAFRTFDPKLPVMTLDWFDHFLIPQSDVKIHFLPAHHWSARGLFDRNWALWGSFVIETAVGNIYFAGDTGYGEGVHFKKIAQKFASFRLSLLPIGSYEPRWFMQGMHMNPEEAVKAHKLLQARQSLGIHFGTFRLSDEPYEAPLQDLARALEKYEVPADLFRTLQVGETWEVP